MGQSRWIDDVKPGESGHRVFRATSPLSRGTLKSKGRWKIIWTLLCRWSDDWNCFSHIFFLLISSESTEQSQMCEEYSICQTRTGRVSEEQSDPLLAPADLLIVTPTSSVKILAQENLLQKHKERVERLPQQDRLIKICTDVGFLKNSWSRTVLRDKARWRVLTIYRSSDMSWVHFATRCKINWPQKVGFEGTPKLDPCWKSQPVLAARQIWSGN